MNDKQNIIVYHPTGNQNVRHLLRSLLANGMFGGFFTSVALFRNSWQYRITSAFRINIFKRRTFDERLRKKTHTYIWIGLLSRVPVLKRLFLPKDFNLNTYLDRHVSKKLKRMADKYDGVYCYPNGALEIFRQAKRDGKLCVYEYTMAYYKSILRIQRQEQAKEGWKQQQRVLFDGDKTREMIDEELNLADIVIAPSEFVKTTLLQESLCKQEKIHVVPYGFPAVKAKKYANNRNEPLKLLCVSGLYYLKGIYYLMEAMQSLQHVVHLTVIGTGQDEHMIKALPAASSCTFMGSVPHDEVMNQMRLHDILILPSLADAMGLSVMEAMSVGTPAVVTDTTGAARWIEHGRNGWIVPSRSAQVITDVLLDIAHNRSIIETVGTHAAETARRWTWDDYGNAVVKLISSERISS